MLLNRANLQYAGMLVILSLAAGGISQKPKPLAAPGLNANSTQYLGDAVSGPQQGTLAVDPTKGAFVAQVRLYSATEMTNDKLDPLGTGARLVLASRDRQPVLATGDLTSSVRWGNSTVADAFATQLDVAPPRQVVK